ncbi:MAG: excinuclease ABC subunit C [Bacteroidales bacterium]
MKLVYFEEFKTVQQAYHREKQVQGWCRQKKEALILYHKNDLPDLSIAYRDRK